MHVRSFLYRDPDASLIWTTLILRLVLLFPFLEQYKTAATINDDVVRSAQH